MSAADYFFVLSAIYLAKTISKDISLVLGLICCILGVIAFMVAK